MALGRGRCLPNTDVVNVIKLGRKIVAFANSEWEMALCCQAAQQGWLQTPTTDICGPKTPFLSLLLSVFWAASTWQELKGWWHTVPRALARCDAATSLSKGLSQDSALAYAGLLMGEACAEHGMVLMKEPNSGFGMFLYPSWILTSQADLCAVKIESDSTECRVKGHDTEWTFSYSFWLY